MSLSLRQKSTLYHELGVLLRAGRPFPAATQLLASESSGATRRLLQQLNAATENGKTVGEAFAAHVPTVSHLEATTMNACDKSGRLPDGCAYLSDYFTQLDTARRSIVRKALYPIFILHMGVFVTGLPALVLKPDIAVYLKSSVGVLILVYCYTFVIGVLAWSLVSAGTWSAFVDQLLRMIPGVGKMRRAFALSRFCATYEMQLQSGINVMDSLTNAAQASQSALVTAAVQKALPSVRGGAQVGPLLSGSAAFTEAMVRSIRIGEETGSLDAELKRLAVEFREESMRRMDLMASVLSKGIYFAAIGYVGYRIVMGYMDYLHTMVDMFDK